VIITSFILLLLHSIAGSTVIAENWKARPTGLVQSLIDSGGGSAYNDPTRGRGPKFSIPKVMLGFELGQVDTFSLATINFGDILSNSSTGKAEVDQAYMGHRFNDHFQIKLGLFPHLISREHYTPYFERVFYPKAPASSISLGNSTGLEISGAPIKDFEYYFHLSEACGKSVVVSTGQKGKNYCYSSTFIYHYGELDLYGAYGFSEHAGADPSHGPGLENYNLGFDLDFWFFRLKTEYLLGKNLFGLKAKSEASLSSQISYRPVERIEIAIRHGQGIHKNGPAKTTLSNTNLGLNIWFESKHKMQLSHTISGKDRKRWTGNGGFRDHATHLLYQAYF
jgi:hypothetical protein